ncbi:hypothetical protein ACP4OV_027307 [Aristida adscensionis]
MPSANSQKSAPDRISALPDDMLLDIMSFLTLQEAVQTSLLSRRWRNIWASLNWLNFDATEFSSMKTFKKFVDSFLLNRSSLPEVVPLDVFWTSATDDSLDYSDIHPWVCHALISNALAVGIMNHCGAKRLSMEGYPFPFTSFENCSINFTMLSTTTLTDLAISSTQTDADIPKEFQHLVIDTPNLVTLHLEEIPRRNIHLLDVSLVQMASIYLFSLSFENSGVNCSILSALSNATNLVLVVPKVLQRDLLRCETFRNLKYLKLCEWFLSNGCYPLLYLLQHSPCIETVVLQLDKSGADDYDDHVRFPNADAEIDPLCKKTEITFSCEKLRKIKIYCLPREKRAQIIVRILSAHLSPLPEIKVKPIKVQDGN